MLSVDSLRVQKHFTFEFQVWLQRPMIWNKRENRKQKIYRNKPAKQYAISLIAENIVYSL